MSSDPSVYDSFPVTIGSIVQPESPINVHVGGVIKFTVGHESDNNENNERWFSDDERALKIDKITGYASALMVGKPNIFLKDMVNFKSTVNIFRVNKASLSVDAPKVLTNIEGHLAYRREYKIPIKFFYNDKELTSFKSNSNNINNSLDLICEVRGDVNDLLDVSSEI